MQQRAFLMVVYIFVLLPLWAASPPAVIAHRGGAGLAPENTLLCIEKSIASGVDAVEVDVRVTADGFIVVCHDDNVKRTTDGKGRISKMTLREVQACKIVGPDGVATNETIPTLAQVLSLVAGRCSLLVEVKRGCGRHKGFEEMLIKEIVAAGASSWVSVQSFSDRVLRRLHELDAPFPLEKLVVLKIPFLPLVVDGGLSFFSFKKYDYVSSFNMNVNFFSKSFAAKVREKGHAVKVWCLNDAFWVYKMDVDAIITDVPCAFVNR